MSSRLIDLFRMVLEASWQSSLIILLILLLRPLMGSKIPALWRYLLWMLVLIRLLVPISLFPPNPVSMQNIPAVDRPMEQMELILPSGHEEPVPTFDRSAPDMSVPSSAPLPASPIPWWTVISTIWFAGTLFMMGLMICAQILLWRRLAKNGRSVDPLILAAWDNCRARLCINVGPSLCMSPDITSPALVGWFFPVLLLPEKSFSSLSPEDWENIFVHELAHYQRGDHWTHTVQLVALAVHWFNPLVWIGFRQLRVDRELAADEWALQHLDPERTSAYGDTLLKVLTQSSQPLFSTAGVGIVEDGSQLKQRLRRIVTFGQKPLLATLTGATLVLLLTVITLGYHWDHHPEYQWLAPEQIFMRAIKVGDISTVKKMLDAGMNPNLDGGADNNFPLYAAVDYNQPEIVKLLISHGADVNKKTGWGDSACYRACWLGYKDSADLLIQAGAPRNDLIYYAGTGDVRGLEQVNAKKSLTAGDVRNGLSFAAASGNENTFDWLLPRLAPMNAEQKEGLFDWLYDMAGRGGHLSMIRHLETIDSSPKFDSTALDSAIVWNRVDLVKYLLSKPGFYPTPSGGNATLLFSAQSPEMAEFLIKHGELVNARNKDGETVLMRICAYSWNPPETALVLLKHGADPNARDNIGITALMRAQDGAMVDELIHYGADINARTNNGMGVLAAGRLDATGSREVALVRHGIPFDPKKEGPSMLVQASWAGQLTFMSYLLDHGVDPNTPAHGNGKKGMMLPLEAAIVFEQDVAVNLLLEHGAKPDAHLMANALKTPAMAIVKLFWDHGLRTISPLCYAVSQGAKVDELQKILDQGSPVDPPEDNVISPLGVAAELGNLPAVKFLIEHGANVNGPLSLEAPKDQKTPLCLAAFTGKDEVVAYLLEHGDKSDFQAVWNAVSDADSYGVHRWKEHFEKTVQIFIDAGALKGLSEQDSAKLLQAAIFNYVGRPSTLTVLKMLLNAGLSFQAKNADGKTVLEYVQEKRQTPGTSLPPRRHKGFS